MVDHTFPLGCLLLSQVEGPAQPYYQQLQRSPGACEPSPEPPIEGVRAFSRLDIPGLASHRVAGHWLVETVLCIAVHFR